MDKEGSKICVPRVSLLLLSLFCLYLAKDGLAATVTAGTLPSDACLDSIKVPLVRQWAKVGQGGFNCMKCCLIIAKSCECGALNGIVLLPIDIIGWFGLGQSIAREARHQVMSCCRCNLFTGALLLKCISRISRPHFFKTKKICPRSSADLFNSCQRVVSE